MLTSNMLPVTRDGRVAVLTIDRPNRRNALGRELVSGIGKALRDLDSDNSIGAIVLTGTPPGFCAGSDLKELGELSISDMCSHEKETGLLAQSIGLLTKPVIAAVEGFALGGGFVLGTCCDIVVTTEICRWQLPEVTIGWIPPWGLESLLSRCTLAVARQLVWGAEPINGSEAFRLGVADYLAVEGEALKNALGLGHKLASLPAHAIAATKRYFSMSADAGRGDSEANRLFGENCNHEIAKATLRKYGARV